MKMPRISAALAAALLAFPGLVQETDAQQPDLADLKEWVVPWEDSRPRDPHVAPDGLVWFVGQTADYVASLDPESGDFKRYDLEEGAGPHNVVVGAAGDIWYTGNRATHVGRLDPATGDIHKIMMPEEAARDPHTLIFDDEGDLWFTVQGGNYVGKLWKETGEVRLIEAPEVESRRGNSSRPYGIKVDAQGRPWIALFNTNQIATVDPETFELETFMLPEGARPRRLEVTSDDVVWYVDYARGFLGRLDPETGDVTEWANPSGEGARPYGMAVDKDDQIWFVETGVQPNRFVGFDPETEEYFSISEVESGGGTIRHMYYDASSGAVWFGADTNTIGRAMVPTRQSRRRVS
ncbi:MAG: lyase [Gemmatimonadota bacterium]|nr:lyase [Gemmatimonadota bacterium]